MKTPKCRAFARSLASSRAEFRPLGDARKTPYPGAMFSLFRKRARNTRFEAPLAPDRPFVAIGDVHGSDGLLARILDRVDKELPEGPVICVGDYVDRGENSAGVIDLLMTRQAQDSRLICLMGNHERMMLDFLDAPSRSGARWMRYGGLQTVASFGLRPPSAGADEADWRLLRDQLEAALGAKREAWLRALPLQWQSGNVAVVHAAADPDAAIDAQSEQTLLWGHPEFAKRPRSDDIWVIHGHTIVETPLADQGRIATDTGAYATGRLTAVHITPGNHSFLST